MKESEIIKALFEKLISSNYHIFPLKGKVNVTDNHEIYVIYNQKNEVLHVGNTPSGKKGLIKGCIIIFHAPEFFMKNT